MHALIPAHPPELRLRPAAETMKRVRLLNSDEDTTVDRRIVVKLLTTYFERGQPPDVLQLMARMLGFSGADSPPSCRCRAVHRLSVVAPLVLHRS